MADLLETDTKDFVQKTRANEASAKADSEKRMTIYRQTAEKRAKDLDDKAKRAEERAQQSETRARIEEERANAADQKARAYAEGAHAEAEKVRAQTQENMEEFQRRARVDAESEASGIREEMRKAAEISKRQQYDSEEALRRVKKQADVAIQQATMTQKDSSGQTNVLTNEVRMLKASNDELTRKLKALSDETAENVKALKEHIRLRDENLVTCKAENTELRNRLRAQPPTCALPPLPVPGKSRGSSPTNSERDAIEKRCAANTAEQLRLFAAQFPQQQVAQQNPPTQGSRAAPAPPNAAPAAPESRPESIVRSQPPAASRQAAQRSLIDKWKFDPETDSHWEEWENDYGNYGSSEIQEPEQAETRQVQRHRGPSPVGERDRRSVSPPIQKSHGAIVANETERRLNEKLDAMQRQMQQLTNQRPKAYPAILNGQGDGGSQAVDIKQLARSGELLIPDSHAEFKSWIQQVTCSMVAYDTAGEMTRFCNEAVTLRGTKQEDLRLSLWWRGFEPRPRG